MSLRNGSVAIRFAECEPMTQEAADGLQAHALPSLEMMDAECAAVGEWIKARNVRA